MNLIRNERLKLLATYLNGLAIAIFAVGGLAPAFSTLYSDRITPASHALIWTGLGCFAVSVALHYAASIILKRLLP